MKNYNEILEIVKEKCEDGVQQFAYGDFDQEALGLGEIKEVAQHGGEDEGSDWYSVKHFVDHNVYIKVSGWYSSYNGTDFDGDWECCEQVTPQEKTITVYQ